MAEWPVRRTETQQAWEDYREAGGSLDYYGWLDAGMPSTLEERSANAFLERFRVWATEQVASGIRGESEIDVISQDLYDQLTGQGQYVGIKKTVAEISGPVVTAVNSYWSNLPVQRQREIEAQAGQAQQREQDIASQYAQLPLGARGSPEEQVIAGQQAIQRLMLQRPASPAYLQPIIDQQISQLQQSIFQLQGSIRQQAGQRTEDGELISGQEARVRQAERLKEEEESEPGSMAQSFAQKYGMSPEAAAVTGMRYAQNPESEEFANLTKEERSSLAWVGMEATSGGGTRKPPPEPIETPTFGQVGAQGSPTWKSWFTRNYPSITSEFEGKPAEEQTYEGWSAFLAKERKRLKEEFAKQSPYARGERPGAYAPKIRTVSF